MGVHEVLGNSDTKGWYMVSGAPSFSLHWKTSLFCLFLSSKISFPPIGAGSGQTKIMRLCILFQVLNVSQVLNAGYCNAISAGCWVHNSMHVGSFKIRLVEDKDFASGFELFVNFLHALPHALHRYTCTHTHTTYILKVTKIMASCRKAVTG